MDYQKLKARYDETREYKDRWLGLYKDLYFYVLPDRDAFNVKWNYRDDGKPTTLQVWDTTAVLAAYQRANDLHGLLLPKDRVWGRLVMDKHLFNEEVINSYQPIMDEINDRIFFYINESNLSRVINGSNLDLIGGTGALWVESHSDDEPLYFRSIPAVALYIEYSTDDLVSTSWYQCKITGRKIRDFYPNYRGSKLSALIEAPNDQYSVIFGQIKENNGDYFIYGIMEEDPFTPLFEIKRDYPQLLIYRDRVRPGEADGRGIGMDMLPPIKDLNRLVEYRTKNMAFKAYPPMFYDSNSYFNPYSIRQWAGMMVPRAPQARNPLEALQMPEYPDIMPTIMDMREWIYKGFMIDPLGEITSPVKSATEISIREKRAQRSASTDISRLINELPRQVYEVAAKILSDRRLLTRDRSVSLNMRARKFKFDYQSPLYDLQKSDNLSHFITNMQVKQQFFGAGSPAATVNLPKANKYLTEWLNLPTDLMVTEDQLKEYLERMSQMAQQGVLPPPSTTAGKPNFPENPNVTV